MPSSRIVTTTPRPVMFFFHTGPTFMSNPLGPTVCPVKDAEGSQLHKDFQSKDNEMYCNYGSYFHHFYY